LSFVLLGLSLFKIVEILCVLAVFGHLFVFPQFSMVFLFGAIGLAFINVFFGRLKALPIFPYQLGNLCEGEILALEVFPHFV